MNLKTKLNLKKRKTESTGRFFRKTIILPHSLSANSSCARYLSLNKGAQLMFCQTKSKILIIDLQWYKYKCLI